MFDSDDLDAVPGLIAAVESALGPIDIYVANTGGPPMGPDPLAFTREQWEAAHRTLVLSPMAFIERLLPGMQERRWGRILAVSSSSVLEPLPAIQLSNAHRPGLIAAFKVLARRVAADGVTLNSILAGRIATDRVAGGPGGLEAAQQAARGTGPRGAPGHGRGVRRRRRVPVLGARRLHHRHDAARGRRAHPGRALDSARRAGR